MNQTLEIAKIALLEPAGIQETQLERILGNIISPTIDAADMYFQTSYSESWLLEDGIVKSGDYNIDRGVGVRAISGEKTGFAYSNDIALATLQQAASTASNVAFQGGKHLVAHLKNKVGHHLYPVANPLNSFTENEKIALLKQLDCEARVLDKRVKQVMVSLAGEHEIVMIINSHGQLATDVRPLVRLNITVIVEDKGQRQQGYAGGGGRFDYNYFTQENRASSYVHEAVRQALINLEAKPAPAGTMPVVLGSGWAGVLLHEAIGHGLEGDFNRKGSSAFSGRIGSKVASELCTIVDDGTLVGRRGSLNIDDEGEPTQCTVLIENGILKGYMQDRLNARLMGGQSTGNGRRESYAHLPLPRMTNTYMLPGKHSPEEIIASVKKGIYAVNFAGGEVDITSGKFVFSTSEAYLIEDGKITHPVKGATLIGNGPDVLTRVSMVGNDLKLDPGIGICGKEGQQVPVGVGQPTIKIDSLTVGGTDYFS